MREHRSEEYRRHQQQRERFSEMHRIYYIVGPLALGSEKLVYAHNNKSRERQTVQQPRLRAAQLCHIADAEVKRRPDEAAEHPGNGRKGKPFAQRRRVQPYFPYKFPHCIHFHNTGVFFTPCSFFLKTVLFYDNMHRKAIQFKAPCAQRPGMPR